MSIIKFKNSAGKQVFGNAWKLENETDARANIVITHGMCEYSGRYEQFALELNKLGFNVYAIDHPGHGLNVTATDNPEYALGVWPSSGFKLSVENLYDFITEVRLTMKPTYLLGHSMGSIIAQRYYQRYPNTIEGLILSGSFTKQGSLSLARHLINLENKFIKPEMKERPYPSMFKKQQVKFSAKFKTFAYEDGYKSPNAYLSTVSENVKKYDLDPLCNFTPSFNFYFNLFNGMKPTFQQKRVKELKIKPAVLILTGSDDPVTGYSKSAIKLEHFYKNAGVNVTHKIYQGFRHEILFDTCQQEILKDFMDFIALTKTHDKVVKDEVKSETKEEKSE